MQHSNATSRHASIPGSKEVNISSPTNFQT